VAGNPKVAATQGQVALERGPLVYCFEGMDNEGSVIDVVLPSSAQVVPVAKPGLLGGVTVLEVEGAARVQRKKDGGPDATPARMVAVPYAFWNNRGAAPMSVWLARDAAHARGAAAN
jgi:DUF1680 family protein